MYIPKIRRLSKSKDLTDIMKVEILSLSVTFVYEFENYKSILNSTEVRGFDVLENTCFRKSVVETQISQKMILFKNT